MTDLEKLIEQIEAGGVWSLHFMEDALEAYDVSVWDAFVGAINGSLDAAKALHEALLPDWAVADISQNGRLAGHPWGVRLELWNANAPSKNKVAWAGYGGLCGLDLYVDYTPARAWLLAILRAYAAQQEPSP